MKPFLILFILASVSFKCLAQTHDAIFINKKYDLQHFISRKFNFPEKVDKRGLQTILLLTFKVDKRGHKNSIYIAGNTGGIDTIVYQAFKALVEQQEFKWKPAMHYGKPIDSYVAIPINMIYEFGDEALEGEFLKVESYQGSYKLIIDQLYKLKNYQLFKNIILVHYGAMY